MRVTQQERDILAHLQFNADSAVATIAKAVGCREHIVRSVLFRFGQLDLFTPRVFIDALKLGYSRYVVLFAVTSLTPQTINRFVQELVACDAVSCILELGGEYQFEVHITCRGPVEFSNILDRLAEQFRDLVSEKSICIQVVHSIFASKSLSAFRPAPSELSWQITNEHVQIDELDHQILRNLALDGGISRATLARKLGTPVSTVQYRIQSLQEKRVIHGFTYEYRGSVLGLRHYAVLVRSRGADATCHHAMREFARNNPHVTYYSQNIASWDYQMGIAVDNDAAASQVMHEIYSKMGNRIGRCILLPVLRAWKVIDYPFTRSLTKAAEAA
ncbi:MAG: Winged helix-turn-helix DNA-binding [Pseudomonadota bacterium]|jgi:DNA-binding Lrp family transcriptional regulator